MRVNPFLMISLFSALLAVHSPMLAVEASATKQDQTNSSLLTEHKDMQFIFLLPVIEGKVALKIIIPKSFKALQGDPQADLLEFIPNTDQDPYQWSQIITLNKILGKGIKASDYIQKLKNLFINANKSSKIIETKQHNYGNYQDASMIIQYKNNAREEIVIFYSVSGPYDIANFQYALPLSSNDNLNKTVQKLKDFVKDHVELQGSDRK